MKIKIPAHSHNPGKVLTVCVLGNAGRLLPVREAHNTFGALRRACLKSEPDTGEIVSLLLGRHTDHEKEDAAMQFELAF